MRILVTGGAGFIGSHTCVALLEKGYEIIVLDSYINSHEKSLKRVIQILELNSNNDIKLETLRSDIRDSGGLEKIFSQSKRLGKPIIAVLHFAGLKAVEESVRNPLHYWDVNVNGSINLFRVMDKYRCRTIIFSSSATIYNLSNNDVLLESSEIKPTNPYGSSKATIEKILNDIFLSNKLEWRIANLRYFNPIGAHTSGLIGESPIGVPNNIFPYITQVASGNLEKLTVFGSDWPTLDGTGVRDYIHVMDVAEGHIAALEYLINGEPQIININLGTQIGTSVLELINTFERVNNVKIPYQFQGRRVGDSCSVIADNSLATNLLEWFPKRNLEEMCIDGWKWQLSNPYGFE